MSGSALFEGQFSHRALLSHEAFLHPVGLEQLGRREVVVQRPYFPIHLDEGHVAQNLRVDVSLLSRSLVVFLSRFFKFRRVRFQVVRHVAN